MAWRLDAVLNALDGDARAGGDRGDSAGVADQVLQGIPGLDLVDGRIADAAGEGHLVAGRRNEDHIAGQQLGVLGLVAVHEQIVQIEMGHNGSTATQLDVAEGAVDGGTVAGEQCVDQGAEGADGVDPGAARLPGHVDLNGADHSQVHGHIEIVKDPPHGLSQVIFERGERDPRHVHRADVRKVDFAGAVDGEIGLKRHLSPDPDAQFVTGANHVVGRNRRHLERGKGGGHVAEKIGSVDGENLPGGGCNEFLKLGEGLRRQLQGKLGGWVLALALQVQEVSV